MKRGLEKNNGLSTQDWRWSAVTAKDKSYDGILFFAVRTTGIFCRPSCSSRTPNKENVEYFYSPKDAEQGGYRPCKKCRPDEKIKLSGKMELVVQSLRILSENKGESYSVKELCKQISVSEDRLQIALRSVLNIRPKELIEYLKMEYFKSNVKKMSVTEAVYESGFSSSRAVYEQAARKMGMTPAKYKKGGSGITVNYAITNTLIGKMLIAATEIGICSAAFGDDEAELKNGLKTDFFSAQIFEDEERLSVFIDSVNESFITGRELFDLPLDIRGTAFQIRVWAELRKIPFGSTLSYGELAKMIGNPKAHRAVARACATNPVALITPCHRVIGSNGKLSGYKWGIEKKAKLLINEQEFQKSLKT